MLGEFFNRIRRHSDALLAVGVMGLVLLMIIPLPPLLLDALLCLSIVFSLMCLLLTLYVEDALEFSSFPSLLLFLTLYRLGLNLASTRMLLTRGEAGDIINTFGEFVTHGSVSVGLILFSLLTIINFIVVTKGAGRIAEVAARFTLEALPGKQLAIDSEISTGTLSQSEAKQARKIIEQEASFYGAMDGASKFVRGDAIASVVITLVNILGGFAVGLMVKGYGWQECLSLFTRLTIGDGLVSQIPALLISVAAGIMVTRASSGNLSKNLTKEMFHHPKVMVISGVTLLFLSFVPGMPYFVILPVAAALFLIGFFQMRSKEVNGAPKPQSSEHSLFVCPIEVELGYQSAALASGLQKKIGELRKRCAARLGFRLPAVQISDNFELPPSGWVILVKGSRIATGRDATLDLLTQRLSTVIRGHAHELINRQEISQMIQEVKAFDSAVVDELAAHEFSAGQILKVVQNLLKEQVSIRDFATILELLADSISEGTSDAQELTENVRLGLSRGISETFFGTNRHAHVIVLDPRVEQILDVSKGKLLPKIIDRLAHDLIQINERASSGGIRPVIVTQAPARPQLKKIVEKHLPELPVLSYQEINADVTIETVGTISNEILSGT